MQSTSSRMAPLTGALVALAVLTIVGAAPTGGHVVEKVDEKFWLDSTVSSRHLSRGASSFLNMRTPTLNAEFRSKQTSDILVDVDDWGHMGLLERYLAQDPSRISPSLRRRAATLFSAEDWNDWTRVKRAMQSQFVADKCATTFDVKDEHWVSCCLLKCRKTNKDVGFCASHEAAGLPNLCRAPQRGVDYKSAFGKRIGKDAVQSDGANFGDWSCAANSASVYQPAPPVTQPAPPVTQPEPPVAQPAPPVTQPEPPVAQPEPPVNQSESPAYQPAPPVERPTLSSDFTIIVTDELFFQVRKSLQVAPPIRCVTFARTSVPDSPSISPRPAVPRSTT
jgi:hypothetical protein